MAILKTISLVRLESRAGKRGILLSSSVLVLSSSSINGEASMKLKRKEGSWHFLTYYSSRNLPSSLEGVSSPTFQNKSFHPGDRLS
jgi:hypothetical protein